MLEAEVILKNISAESICIWVNAGADIGMTAIPLMENGTPATNLTILLVSSDAIMDEEESDIPDFIEIKSNYEYKLRFKTNLLDFLSQGNLYARTHIVYSLPDEIKELGDVSHSALKEKNTILNRKSHHLITGYIKLNNSTT